MSAVAYASADTIFKHRTANLLAVYLDCQAQVIIDPTKATFEEAYAHVFGPASGCRWCQGRLAQLNEPIADL